MSKKKTFRMTKPTGFTLIELLIVIAVTGILAAGAMALINPFEQIKKARDAQRKHDLVQIQQALDAYYTDRNTYPAHTKDDPNPRKNNQISAADWGSPWVPYIAKLPKDPNSNQDYYYKSNGTSYRLYAKLEHCPDSQAVGNNCATDPYNYTVNSPDLSPIALTPSGDVKMDLKNATITASNAIIPSHGPLSVWTDGIVPTPGPPSTTQYVELPVNPQWIQVDLGGPTEISKIKIWHYYGDLRKYNDVIVQLSTDLAFLGPPCTNPCTTVFNNDVDGSAGQGSGSDPTYQETSLGYTILSISSSSRRVARYIRTWTNGSNRSDGSFLNGGNHHVEIEVYQYNPL